MICYDLVPSQENIEGCLRHDDLRGGRDQRNPTQVFTDSGDFVEYLVQSIQSILPPELAGEVRHDSTRNLSHEHSTIHPTVRRLELVVEPSDRLGHFSGFGELLQVAAGLVT